MSGASDKLVFFGTFAVASVSMMSSGIVNDIKEKHIEASGSVRIALITAKLGGFCRELFESVRNLLRKNVSLKKLLIADFERNTVDKMIKEQMNAKFNTRNHI